MKNWGKRTEDAEYSEEDLDRWLAPGWLEDPDRPGVQRYWGGEDWDDLVPPRPTPPSTWHEVRVVALGVLVALVVASTVFGILA